MIMLKNELKHTIRSFVGLYPELFFPLVQLKNSKFRAVSQDTEICIEGFPRSGNSFAVGAFTAAQVNPVKIAHHFHVPAQIISAARQNIPTLVLIRNPADAVISLRALDLQMTDVRPPRLPRMSSTLKYYIEFYQRILPYQDRYIVCEFEEVKSDFGKLIEKLNKKFDKNFSGFSHTEEKVNEVFASRGVHASPSQKRQEIKQLIQKELETSKMEKLINRAKAVYNSFEVIAQNQKML